MKSVRFFSSSNAQVICWSDWRYNIFSKNFSIKTVEISHREASFGFQFTEKKSLNSFKIASSNDWLYYLHCMFIYFFLLCGNSFDSAKWPFLIWLVIYVSLFLLLFLFAFTLMEDAENSYIFADGKLYFGSVKNHMWFQF